MKLKIILSIMYAMLICVNSVFAQINWKTEVASTPDNMPISVHSNKSGKVFILSLNVDTAGYQHELLISVDSGNTWITKDIPGSPGLIDNYPKLNKLFSLDDQNIYFVGDSGYFIKTSDAGTTWSTRKQISNWNLYDVSFADSLHGLAVAQAGLIYTTSDGGNEWVEVSCFSKSLIKACYSFPNGRYYAASVYYGRLFTSTNYGATWDTVNIYEKYTGRNANVTTKLFFLDSLRGFIIGGSYKEQAYLSLISMTTDGGSSWEIIVDSSAYIQDLFGISFFSDSVGFVTGRGNFSLVTSDGGETWNLDSINADSEWDLIIDVHAVSPNKAIALTRLPYRGGILSAKLEGQQGKVNYTMHTQPQIVTSDGEVNLFIEQPDLFTVTVFDALGRIMTKYTTYCAQKYLTVPITIQGLNFCRIESVAGGAKLYKILSL